MENNRQPSEFELLLNASSQEVFPTPQQPAIESANKLFGEAKYFEKNGLPSQAIDGYKLVLDHPNASDTTKASAAVNLGTIHSQLFVNSDDTEIKSKHAKSAYKYYDVFDRINESTLASPSKRVFAAVGRAMVSVEHSKMEGVTKPYKKEILENAFQTLAKLQQVINEVPNSTQFRTHRAIYRVLSQLIPILSSKEEATYYQKYLLSEVNALMILGVDGQIWDTDSHIGFIRAAANTCRQLANNSDSPKLKIFYYRNELAYWEDEAKVSIEKRGKESKFAHKISAAAQKIYELTEDETERNNLKQTYQIQQKNTASALLSG